MLSFYDPVVIVFFKTQIKLQVTFLLLLDYPELFVLLESTFVFFLVSQTVAFSVHVPVCSLRSGNSRCAMRQGHATISDN